MRRFRFVLLALALVGGSVLVAPAADAHTTSCVAQGAFSTGVKMTLTGPAVNTSFSATDAIPFGCPSLSGTFTGNCSLSRGQGGSDGHKFTFTGVGNTLYLEGGVKGTVTIFQDGDTIPCDREDRFDYTATLTYSH